MRAFFDIDTQIDFVFPAGALYVPGSNRIIPVLASLNRFAMARGIPLVSTMCAHEEQDPEFTAWPPHCVLGTVGQQKPAQLLCGQRLFPKQTTDLFLSPDAEPLLAGLGAEEFVVYGVVTEVCVQAAAFGLLARGKRVSVVEDAVMQLSPEGAGSFWKQLAERGGKVTTSREVLESV